MDPGTYLREHYREYQAGNAFTLLSEGSKRTAFRNVHLLDRFLVSRGFDPTVSLTMDHLIAFFLYRVRGERLAEDIHSGSVSLGTFLNSDLSPLFKLLSHQGRLSFSLDDFRKSAGFKDCLITCRKRCGEVTAFSSARPIYPQDEARLRSCLTLDTASKRDEAILVLALRSGFRTKSLSLIRMDLHVQEIASNALEIIMPSCKTNRLMNYRQIVTEDDYNVLMRWINHRKNICQDCPYLFFTSKGTRISCDSVTMMLSDLSVSAGYGRGFFSSHSFRVGYASRVAAEGYSRNDSTEQIYERLCDGTRWERNSRSVSKYIDPNLKSFFRDGFDLTLEQFFASDPAIVHSLSILDEPQRRPLNWFCTPSERLIRMGRNIRFGGTRQPRDIRVAIGRTLFSLDSTIREFVCSVEERSGKSLNRILEELVGCLLEDEIADVGRIYNSGSRQLLFECLVVDKLRGREVQCARRAQKTVIHSLRDRDSTQQLLHNLTTKRVYDRKLHLGILPNEDLVLMRTRDLEQSCREAQLPVLDLDLHFAEQGRAEGVQALLDPTAATNVTINTPERHRR